MASLTLDMSLSKLWGFAMDREALIFCTGVIPAISSTVRKLTTPNENVILQTPVYNCSGHTVFPGRRQSIRLFQRHVRFSIRTGKRYKGRQNV